MLRDKAFNIVKHPKYDGYQRGLVSMVYRFFDKKTVAGAFKNEVMQTKGLTKELRKQIIRAFEKRKVQSSYIDNIWGPDLADMQLLSKFNKGMRFLCVIDIYSKYAGVILLKDKKGITITNAFQNILNNSGRKPNKVWVDKGSEFYNKTMKSWPTKNGIEMYSTLNEGKSVVSERFIRTL